MLPSEGRCTLSPTHFYLIDHYPDLFEAKAILLGRLGRHDSALEVYAYRLRDFQKAEEYCKRIYQPSSPTSNVFLTLLRQLSPQFAERNRNGPGFAQQGASTRPRPLRCADVRCGQTRRSAGRRSCR